MVPPFVTSYLGRSQVSRFSPRETVYAQGRSQPAADSSIPINASQVVFAQGIHLGRADANRVSAVNVVEQCGKARNTSPHRFAYSHKAVPPCSSHREILDELDHRVATAATARSLSIGRDLLRIKRSTESTVWRNGYYSNCL
jgi:hypothetical protein